MRVEYIRTLGPEWMMGPMNATQGKDMLSCKRPSIKTWRNMLLSIGGVPHSPIRAVMYRIFVFDLKSWVAVHYVRHHVGVIPYVKSQRDDRNKEKISRDDMPQGRRIEMMFDMNANALLTIAKARLCMKASKETRAVFVALKDKMMSGDKYDQEVAKLMRPPCEWYNICYEPQPCNR
jgi:hypothetical protein